jgi:hypothetical protein
MGAQSKPLSAWIAAGVFNRMLYTPWTLTTGPSRKKLRERFTQFAKRSSRAESHCIGQRSDDDLSARDSRMMIAAGQQSDCKIR